MKRSDEIALSVFLSLTFIGLIFCNVRLQKQAVRITRLEAEQKELGLERAEMWAMILAAARTNEMQRIGQNPWAWQDDTNSKGQRLYP